MRVDANHGEVLNREQKCRDPSHVVSLPGARSLRNYSKLQIVVIPDTCENARSGGGGFNDPFQLWPSLKITFVGDFFTPIRFAQLDVVENHLRKKENVVVKCLHRTLDFYDFLIRSDDDGDVDDFY